MHNPGKIEKKEIEEARQEYRIQRALEEYSAHRPLPVPRTTYFGLTVHLLVLLLLAATVPVVLNKAAVGHKVLWFIFLYLIVFEGWARLTLIKSVECYQHYADEETRRRCRCLPSCSQYAIAVLKRYELFLALFKIGKRLTKTCKGEAYSIDLPYKGYPLPPEIEKSIKHRPD